MSEENRIIIDRIPNGGAPIIPKALRKTYRDNRAIGDLEETERLKEQPERIFIERLRNENE